MTSFKHYLLATTMGLCFLSSNAVAADQSDKASAEKVEGLNAKISAYAHFQAGARNQNNLNAEERRISRYKHRVAFFNEAAVIADISNKMDDVEYGARIILSTSARTNTGLSRRGTKIYIQTEYGKVELGSPVVPSATMMLDSSEITAGSGSWARYSLIAPKYQEQNDLNPTFVTSPDFFLSDKFTARIDKQKFSSEPARTIVYYSPKFDISEKTKAQIGISYTPDSSNTGAGQPSEKDQIIATEVKEIGDPAIDRFEFDIVVKDAVTAGLTVEHNFSDGVDLKVAFSGEYGKSQGVARQFASATDTDPVATYRLSDVKAFNIGALLTYGNYSFAASYGSLGNSMTTPAYHKTGRRTDYYTAGVAYKQGPFKVSIDYFRSDKFKNEVDAATLGTSYQMAEGLKAYAEITRYQLNGAPEFFSNLPKIKSKGTVLITGLKLSV